jgi:hypothetical protein
MKNRKHGMRTRLICGGLGAFIVIVIFSPGLYTVLWPLIHTRQIDVAGAQFSVPAGWVVIPKNWGSSSTPTMTRLPITLFGMRGNYPTIVVYQRRSADLEDSEALARWKTVAPGEFESRGYKLRSIQEFKSPTAVVCLELTSATGNPESTCFFESNRLMADYYGDELTEDTLYTLIAGARM